MSNSQSAFLYQGAIPRDEKIFGVAGGSLHSAGFNESSTQAGIDGERRVGKVLDDFASRNDAVFAFHSVKLPGHFGDVDHLLIVGGTLFVIDTKNWKSDATYSVMKDQKTVLRDGNEFTGGEVSVNRYVDEFSRFTERHDLTVRGLLVVANSKSRTQRNPSPHWDFVNLTELREVIQKEVRARSRSYVTDGCIESLASRVVNPDFTGDWENIVKSERGTTNHSASYKYRPTERKRRVSLAGKLHPILLLAWVVSVAVAFYSVFVPPHSTPKIVWWGVLLAGLVYGSIARSQTSQDSYVQGRGIVRMATAGIVATAILSILFQSWL